MVGDMDRLTKTWASLIALTLGTVMLAAFEGRLAVAGILALAFFKARLILGRFLHLDAASGWLAAFTVPIAIWLLLIGAGYGLVLR